MKRILLSILSVLLILTMVLPMASCNWFHSNEQETKVGMFFTVNGFSNVVYSIPQSNMTGPELTMIMSLQGLLAQTQATIFIEGSGDSTAEQLDALAKKHGFEVQRVTDPWYLVKLFADFVGKKYVLYNDHSDAGVMYNDQTINYATTICAADSYLMVAKSLENEIQKLGFTLGADATLPEVNTRYIFENYKDKLNNSYLIHQNPGNRNLRDYSIAGKAMCFYSDYYDGDANVKLDILSWAKSNAPILGWTENEINFVSANSLQSVVTVAADHAANLSLYSAGGADVLTQSNHTLDVNLEAEQGKHYLAIVMSDGDNVQWMTKGFGSSDKYFGSMYRGEFPMTWTTSPSLYDLAPDILSDLYANATDNDLFIAGPSGVGYINATEYSKEGIEEYAAYTAGYLEKTDIEYVNFLDNYVDETVLDYFSAYDQIKGGIWSVGNKYIEGNGSVYWSNGKPFVAVRETLWRIAGDDNSNKYYGFVERVAQRINEYSTDCTTIDGYTVLVAHAWSIGSMEYINRFIDALDDHVELVTVDELLMLVEKNVPHDNADTNDIQPDDLDDELCPISSEQYDWDLIKNIPVSANKSFIFTSSQIASQWKNGNGGLEYDSVTWVSSDSRGASAIRLDGSDLDDVIDPLPNAWIYNKFAISENPHEDNFLKCVLVGGTNADVNLRVRALYEENGKMVSVILSSEEYVGTELDSFGWYKRNAKSPDTFYYDLTALKGKEVIISIEQDDTGDGSGEIVFVESVSLVVEKDSRESAFPSFDISDIHSEWEKTGIVETHSEGLCLEAMGGTAAISYTFTVTEETKFAKFYVRVFNRLDNPDTNPKLQLVVGDDIITAINAPNNYVTVTTDVYRCIGYDLSNYVGQEITITFRSITGHHAAIGKIVFDDACELSELATLYQYSQLVAME